MGLFCTNCQPSQCVCVCVCVCIYIYIYIYIYILNTISKILNLNQIGLYRIDGLIYIPNSNGPKTSNLQKKIIREFKNLGFKTEIFSNLKIANFLDITFDLNNNSNKRFNKNNDIPSYINVNSNHPWSIIKQIPTAINLRIDRLSSPKRIFLNNKEPYYEALHKSSFNKKLEFLDLNRTNKYRDNNNNNNDNTKYRMNNTNNSNDHLGNSNYKGKKTVIEK